MAHAQKPDFVFRRNGRVHLNRRGHQFITAASAAVMLDTPSSEVVKGTGYPLHSPVSPSLPLPCVTVCHHIPNGLYIHTSRLYEIRLRYLNYNNSYYVLLLLLLLLLLYPARSTAETVESSNHECSCKHFHFMFL